MHTAPPGRPEPRAPGAQTIGPYRVVRELGRGGMGVVFEVVHPDDPRPLALKLLRRGARPQGLLRFQREAECLARVRHPGVLPVHAAGEDPAGAYLVTDRIEGRSLAETVAAVDDGQGVDPLEAARIVRALADALVAVHAQGVLHRDLKPENVIVRPDGTPVLLDFGLARELDGEALTRTGELLGTPAYMSPEQARGTSPAALDARTDVYGLGATLFALLAGRAPFGGAPLFVVAQVLSEEPRWPRRERPEVPLELEAICRRAMAKAPRRRTPTAAALRDELDRFLARGGADAQEPASRGLLWTATAAGACLLVALVATSASTSSGGALPNAASAGEATSPGSVDSKGSSTGPRTEGPLDLRAAARAELDALVRAGDLPPSLARAQAYRDLLAWRARHAQTPGTGREVAARLLRALREAPLLTWAPPDAGASPGLSWARALDDQRLLVHGAVDGAVWLNDLVAGTTRRWANRAPAQEGAGRAIRALDVVPGARAFAFGGEDRALSIVADTALGGVATRWSVPADWVGFGPSPRIQSIAASPDGATAAVAGSWSEVALIELASGRLLRRFGPHGDGVQALRFTPDGARLVTITGRVFLDEPRADNALRVFEVTTGDLLRTVPCPTRPASLDVSADGRWAAVGTRQWTLHRIELATGAQHDAPRAPDVDQDPLLHPRAHSGMVVGVAFAPGDPSLLYSVSSDDDHARRELRVWRCEPGALRLLRTQPLSGSVTSLALTLDGSWALVGTAGGLEVWGVGPEDG